MRKNNIHSAVCTTWAMCLLLVLISSNYSLAQQQPLSSPCGTIDVLKHAFETNPSLKAKFEHQTIQFQASVNRRKSQAIAWGFLHDTVYVPVVFHVVLTNSSLVTDAQIQAQLAVLNNDFAGLNGDSVNIPAAFKPLFGKSVIRFKLAQRTPDNEPSSGIVRATAAQAAYGTYDRSLKYTTLGGDDAWDHNRFFNVWITNLAGGFVLGYATLPGTSIPAEEGVVIHYATLPATPATATNGGRTLTHEAGHFFYLYHIWGDENGCAGTDFVDDTPNQTTPTGGCPGGAVLTDACTPVAPGILYQNYMDYTEDACMCLFTNDQVTRMETALSDYHAGYFTSNGAAPVPLFSLDAAARKIKAPAQRVCASTIAPVVTLRNRGIQTLSSVDLYTSIDNGAATLTHWTGSLLSLEETAVTLTPLSNVAEGNHIVKVVISSPNGSADMNTANDTIYSTFQYYQPAPTPLTEGFESNSFPPAGWDIVNPDKDLTWERVTGVAKTGNASVVLHNFNYLLNRQKDYLRLPVENIPDGDSAFLTFQVAASVKTDRATAGYFWDTLQVLVSTDCGVTYTSLYKKWGSSLVTNSRAVPTSFVPNPSEWRKDSVDLTRYINAGPILLAFMNTTENENNIYLDDINTYSTTLNPNLVAKGFLVTPNPASDVITVRFYPYPATLKGIVLYNSSGQKIAARAGAGTGQYSFNMSHLSGGVYYVQAIFPDKKLTQKVIKR